jgi:twinkle protein
MQMLSEFLISKGVTLKQQGAEKVCSCLFCDDSKAHMYVNDDKGVFHCHKCGEAGNIWKLKRHYGEINISHKQKKKEYKRPTSLYDLKKDGREYLKAVRGFSDETIAHFKLTQYQDFIAIPYYKDGILVNFKYRNINEKRFQRFTGGESTLFNMDNRDKTKDIVITEGEFDAISSHQLGITNVISVSIGAGSFNPDWIEFFDSCSGAFYIAYDNDTKGEEGAKKLAEKIGSHSIKRVKLPLKDFNDCLMAGYSKEDAQKWLDEAEEYKPQHFVHIADLYQRMDDLYMRKDKGCGTQLDGWLDLNQRLGGFRETEITILTGDTGSGKSTFALNIFFSLVRQGEKILIASTEMATEQVMAMLFTMYIGKNFKEFTDADYQKCVLWFADKPIYFVDIHGRLSIDQIDDYIVYGKRKYDIQYILLDHLHFFIRHTSDNPVTDIENFVFDVVAIGKKTGVNIWLIAHPSKLNNTSGIVTMNDIKGSSAIKQDAHNVITVWRDRDAEEKGFNEVVINFEKVRHTAGLGGKKRYLFNTGGLTYGEKPICGTSDDGKPERAKRNNGYSGR